MKLQEKIDLSQLKNRVEERLQTEFLPSTLLLEAIAYALTTGGKRIRPMITLLTAEALGCGLDVMDAALATEFFHTASLIADDLPCMDNDDYRRDLESLHKKYGETIALLSSYALITEGFRKIEASGRKMRQEKEPFASRAFEATSIALECASRCAGIDGAVYGQFLDLFPEKVSEEAIKKTIYLKTGTLFEGAFVLGYVFGGGEFIRLPDVKQLAYHFGLAFQVRDDLLDLERDQEKSAQANLALFLGESKARALFASELEKTEGYLRSLSLMSSKMLFLLEMLSRGV